MTPWRFFSFLELFYYTSVVQRGLSAGVSNSYWSEGHIPKEIYRSREKDSAGHKTNKKHSNCGKFDENFSLFKFFVWARAAQMHLAGHVFETPALGVVRKWHNNVRDGRSLLFLPQFILKDWVYKTWQRCGLRKLYSVFHQIGQAKFADVGSILSSSQFLLLSQLPQKMELASKVVKIDSKIIILQLWSKYVNLTSCTM
jgi:hypothetical protein